MDSAPEMYTAKELEEILKINRKTLYSYTRRGLIPYIKVQSNVRFLKSQILEWIEEHNFRPHANENNRSRTRSTRQDKI